MMVVPRNSAGAWYYFIKRNFPALRRRMEDLKAIGARFVRLWIPWSEVEKEEGRFDFSYIDDIISTIAATGLRLDITLCSLMAPKWFWDKYSEARPWNERKEPVYKPIPDQVQSASISLWHPQLKPQTAKFIDRCFSLCLDKWAPLILFVKASMGRHNEPNYPDPKYFWCYDPLARADFRARMQEKYGRDVSALNAAWGTGFGTFGEVEVPEPARFKALTTSSRADFIDWYRDVKDEFVLWTIQTILPRLKPHQKLVVYPAGSDDADAHREDFIQKGKVHPALRQMARNFWLIEKCRELGLVAQYAGLGIKVRREFLKQLADRCRAAGIPLYGQIAGLQSRCGEANNPEAIAELIVEFELHGLGWNKDQDVYATATQPNKCFEQLKKAFKLIDDHYQEKPANPVLSGIRHVLRGDLASIEWTTDKPCDGVVIYGTKSGFLSSLSSYSRTFTLPHAVELRGLRTGVPYFYVVLSMDPNGHASCWQERSFTLSP
jgi:hypothetical protein